MLTSEQANEYLTVRAYAAGYKAGECARETGGSPWDYDSVDLSNCVAGARDEFEAEMIHAAAADGYDHGFHRCEPMDAIQIAIAYD